MIEALDWYEKALQFSPSTVWEGVDEAVRLLDEPDAPSTFVQDHIEPMVGWDEIDPINMRFSPEDYEFEITEQGSEYLADSDPEDEAELQEAMEAYRRGEFLTLTVDNIRDRLAQISSARGFISRAQIFHALTVLGGEVKRIFQGGTYTALPDEVREIFALTAPHPQTDEEADISEQDEFIPISSGFSFYNQELQRPG